MARREYISAVEFNVFSAEEIKRFTVCSVTESSMYLASLPTTGSTVDFRMGSVPPPSSLPAFSSLVSLSLPVKPGRSAPQVRHVQAFLTDLPRSLWLH